MLPMRNHANLSVVTCFLTSVILLRTSLSAPLPSGFSSFTVPHHGSNTRKVHLVRRVEGKAWSKPFIGYSKNVPTTPTDVAEYRNLSPRRLLAIDQYMVDTRDHLHIGERYKKLQHPVSEKRRRTSQRSLVGVPPALSTIYHRILQDPRLLSHKIRDSRFVLGDVTDSSFRGMYEHYKSVLDITASVMNDHILHANLTEPDAKAIENLVMASMDY